MDSVTTTRVDRLEAEIEALRHARHRHAWRTRWAAIGAAIAVSLGTGAVIQRSSAFTGTQSTSSFVPVIPFRVFDTRPAPYNVGGWVGPITGNGTHAFTVAGVGQVGSTAVAVVMNVTVTGTTLPGYLTVWPTGQAQPTASNLNWSAANTTVPNLVTVQLGTSGQVSVYNLQGTVHVIADVVGYYTASNDKFMSLPAAGVNSTTGFTDGYGPYAGVKLRDSLADSISYNFVLPPDYTPGAMLTAYVTWHTPATGCSVTLKPNYVSVGRLDGQFLVGPSAYSGMSGGGMLNAGVTPNLIHAVSFTLLAPDGSVLQPGDVYTFSFFRHGSDTGDTCANDMSIDAVVIRYM